MDMNSIKDQVSNLSLYDLKAGVRKVQNAVMNYTEMEAKVREATNNEPWGASSTLMQEIANGTHSYQLLNETMPMIYKRFTEKAAEEWRQIYKALQLLEFLIKNGSERVIDDARSHVSLLKMLRQFHYIDQNGKDQGINVRNRSKELAELLGDVDRIRSERKKARANRNKFGGVEGGAMSGGLSSGSRYGGFGSEDGGYGGYSGGVYGDGGGFGGRDQGFQDSQARRDRFEEYDENDEGGSAAPSRRRPETKSPESRKAEPPKPKEPAVDFLSFDDDDVPPRTPAKDVSNGGSALAAAPNNGLASLSTSNADDDDFDDFQSATPTTTASSKPSIPTPAFSNLPAPMAQAPSQSLNINNLPSTGYSTPASGVSNSLASPPVANPAGGPPAPNYRIDMSSPAPQQAKPFAAPQSQSQSQTQPQQPKPTGYQAATPNYFTSVPTPQAGPASSNSASAPSRPTVASAGSINAGKPAASKPASGGGDAFGSLWSSASSGAGIKKSTAAGGEGPNLASMQREKASQGIWGHSAAPTGGMPGPGSTSNSMPPFGGAQQKSTGGGALDDLLG